ncbi:MAG: aldo/keto reductase [Clostridia bacterium]|nr:aldo/keto reductase [Clostridia bacterium]
MIYKDFKGLRLSALGMGCMRLPVRDGKTADIDEQATAEMVAEAMRGGINYYDTAWGYHDGFSEPVMGKILKDYPRESFYLATKFPGYDLDNMPKVREIFEAQLERLQTDYFDFYLIHNVCEKNIDAYLDPQYGIYDYLTEQVKSGRIRHLGFSAHGSREVIERFLAVYGDAMEFGQLQLNWLDYSFQNAKEKAELLHARGIPVWVMEPLRGGKLVRLAEADEARLHALRPEECMPGWAFRFLQTLPYVTVTLSGMSNIEQLRDNIALFSEDKPLNAAELETLEDIARGMVGAIALPCTACRYCTTHCPMELPIPDIISLYNEHVFTGGGFIAPMALDAYPPEKLPSACVGCQACEAVCPQEIKIADMMSDFAAKLNMK